MAYWNLHERSLSESANGYLVNRTETLCFFHFSGLVIDDPAMLSKNTNRFTLASRPDLANLFSDYKAAVRASRDPARESLAYGFDVFSDGTTVTRLARRIYAMHQASWAGEDPFAAHGRFAAFARERGLVKGKVAPPKTTWNDFTGTDRRVQAVHLALKIALRVLGPHRYELLMRYLAHIAVLRNQSVFIAPQAVGLQAGNPAQPPREVGK